MPETRQPLAWCARLESKHFTFEGYGRTETEANESLGRALARHADQYGLAPGWCDDLLGDCPTFPLHAAGYRDGEAIA